jgi:hypothetical protein
MMNRVGQASSQAHDGASISAQRGYAHSWGQSARREPSSTYPLVPHNRQPTWHRCLPTVCWCLPTAERSRLRHWFTHIPRSSHGIFRSRVNGSNPHEMLDLLSNRCATFHFCFTDRETFLFQLAENFKVFTDLTKYFFSRSLHHGETFFTLNTAMARDFLLTWRRVSLCGRFLTTLCYPGRYGYSCVLYTHQFALQQQRDRP